MSLELVTITAFGHEFRDLFPGNAEDLRTLEREGAIYTQHADRDEDGNFLEPVSFSRYKIQFTPTEIYEYVEAHLAFQQFNEEMQRTGDFAAAVVAITQEKYRKRVTAYGDYGRRPNADGVAVDNRGCLASFCGPHLESLLCGGQRERCEPLPDLGGQSNREELILRSLQSVAVSARRLARRSNGRPAVDMVTEYDIQDLAEVALCAIFDDVVREEWTPKRAGSAKRIDLVIPSVGAVIECKYVRNAAHGKKVADELRIDFECYHDYQPCRQLFAYVYDPGRYIVDPEGFVKDLEGLRRKRDHEFSVTLVVGA